MKTTPYFSLASTFSNSLTCSKLKNNLLRFLSAVILFFSFVGGSWGQVTVTNPGNTTPAMSSTYTSLALAIADVNNRTAISGPVTITLSASQTAPAGGYTITNTAITGGSNTNRFIFDGGGNTITAGIGTSTTTDAFFKIIGADFITIQNFVLSESAGNTTTTTQIEWGIALLYSTTTNGAQNITIQNNSITLNRTNANSIGIYSNSTHTASAVGTSATATGAAGGNSSLKVYGNTITNVNQGIILVGPTAAADANTGIDIGGTASGTGNTITNFGTTTTSSYINVSGTVNGILVRNSVGFNVSYNSITSSNGGVTTGTLNGIQVQASSNAPSAIFTNTINNNTIALTTGFSGAINGINYPSGSASSTSVLNVNNNNFTAATSTVTNSGAITLISIASTNLTTTINSNTFTNISSNTTGSFTFISHSFTMPASGSCSVSSNSIVTAFNKTGAGGTVTLATTGTSSPSTASLTQTNNNFSNITVTGATAITGFSNFDGSSSSCSKTVTGNTFNNWTGGTSAIIGMTFGYWGGGATNTLSNNTITNITGQSTITGISISSSFSGTNTVSFSSNTINNLTSTGTGGQVLGISCANTSTTININGNTIHTLSSTGASSAVGAIWVSAAATTNVYSNTIYNLVTSGSTAPISLGIQISGGTAVNVYQNKIYNLSATGSALTSSASAVSGIYLNGGTTVNTYNNIIGGLTAPSANLADAIRGINILSTSTSTTQRIYYNTINISGTSSGANFGGSGIFHTSSATATTSALDMRNNLIVNSITPTGTGLAVAYRRSSTTLTNYSTTSDNNNLSGTSGLFTDGTNTYTTLASFKTAMSTRDQASQSSTPSFLSTTGSSSNFLKIDPNANSVGIENSGVAIATYTTDFDGDTRNASTPDIGADEFIAVVPCASTPSPTNGTIDVALSPTISWTAATNATGYDVYLGTTSGSLTLVSTNQSGLSYAPSTALSPTTPYYWSIVPRNGTNFASGCTEWSFTTQGATPTLSTTSLSAFANQCINTTSSAISFNISGIYLTTDDITVGPLTGFAFSSTSNGTYTSTLTISQPGGTLASTPIYVQFTPTSTTSFNGNIPVSGGGLASAISVSAVGTGVNTAATASTGVSSSITATSATVAGSFVANCQTITAYGIEYSTTNGFTNGSGIQVSSSNQSSGSFTSSLTGLTNNVTYYYKAFATYGSTTVYGTQSSFTTPQVCSIALQEAFSSTTTPTGWGLTNFYVSSAISGVPTAFTSNYMVVNLFSSTTSANFTTCNYGPVGTNANLTFNYSVTNYNSPYAAPAVGWGNIQVQISTDFGATYTTINTITASASSQTPVSISLSSYAGQYAKFKFIGTWTTGDYYVVIDDINAIAPCTAPNQPTNLTFTNVGPTQMTVNYTASSSSPTGYIMVRYPAGSTPSSPVNGTTYSAGTALGSGTIAYVGSNVSSVITGLSLNTNYDFYVYAYNSVTCTNGPVYNNTSPLSGTQSTTVCPTLSSVVTIGPGYNYATLTDAIVILNGCGITQPTILELQSNYVSTNEAFPITLGAITGASVINTITIRPASGVSSALTITSSNTTGTINHNGGSFFVFDGRPGGSGTSKFITIENTSSAAYAVIFQNESSNNTLRYLTIKGQNTSATSGTIVLSTSTGTNGNDNNTIEYNDICAVNASSAFSVNGIYSSGSTVSSTANNNGTTISNNNIFDFFASTAGVDPRGIVVLSGTDGCTISGNSFYQTTSRSYTNNIFQFINLSNTTNTQVFNVSGNYFGGSQPLCGGTALSLTSTTARLAMVLLSASTTVTSSFNGNTFSNISFTTATTSALSNCIQVNNGSWNIGSSLGNIFGSTTNNGSISFSTTGTGGLFSAIHCGNGSTIGTMTISNNTISGISISGTGTMDLCGMYFLSQATSANSGTYTVENNNIGFSTLSNSLLNSTNKGIYGIWSLVNNPNSTQTINNNVITNLTSTNTGSSSIVYGINTPGSSGGRYLISSNNVNSLSSAGSAANVFGINQTASTTVGQVINGNTIHSLVNSGSSAAVVAGINYSGPTSGTNEIKSNLVHSLSAATSGSTLAGIQIADGGNASVYNNMIRLGINSAGSDITTNALVYGINQSGSASNHSIYFNSIYVGGSGVVSGTNNSAALWSAATSGTRIIRNNVFSNARANGTGTGKNCSIRIAGMTGLTINNNDYWTGTSFLALNNTTDVTSFSAWQTVTSQDLISVSVNPNFVNPTGNSSSLDLHINNATSSALESGGANISTILTDRDGDVRPGPVGSSNGGGISSDIGADEFDGIPGYTCATPVSAGTVATSASQVCSGGSVNLSLTGVNIAGTGNVYQWYTSSDGINYSAINGGTNTTYSSPSLSQNTYYNCVITCLANSGSTTSSSQMITVNALPIAPTANNSTQCGVGIPTATIVSNTGATTPNINWYTNIGATTLAPLTYTGGLVTYYSNSFGSSTITPATMSGSASVTGGILQLTPNTASQLGALTIPSSGVNANKYRVSFDLYTSNSAQNGADGISYSFGDDISTVTYNGEVGSGTKLKVSFDTYGTTANTNDLAGIRIIYGSSSSTPGQTVGTSGVLAFSTNVAWTNGTYPVIIDINESGILTLTVNGSVIFSNIQLPSTYLSDNKASWGHIIRARTGGVPMTQGIDNLVIQQSAGALTIPNSISTTTTYYVTESSGGCTSTATPVTVTVNTAPTITASASSSSICTGQSTTLSATSTNSGYTYSWNNNGGSGASVTVSPSATTTYTVTGTDASGGASNGCSTTATATVTVNPLPTTPTINPSTATLCSGVSTAQSLVAGASFSPSQYTLSTSTATYTAITGTTVSNIVGDDFGVGSLPIGFTFPYNGTTFTQFGVSSNGFIELGSTSNYTSNLTSGWTPSSNALASRANVIAPLWDDNNTTGGTVIYTTSGVSPNMVLTVQWTGLHVGGSGSSTNPTIDMQLILNENGSISFKYGPQSAALSSPTASIGFSGIVGNFLSVTPLNPLSSSSISSSVENTSVNTGNIPNGTILNFSGPSAVWTSSTGLFTNAAASTPYSGTSATIIYALPTSTTTYTLTATSPAGCTASSTATITVNQPTITWTGATSTDPTVASNWNPVALPCTVSDITIPSGLTNYPTYTSLTISSGGSYTLQAGAQLTVTGALTNNGAMTIESGATFKQGTSVAGSGTYNVKQTIDNGAGSGTTLTGRFWYLGSPLACSRSSAFGTAGSLNKVWEFTNGAYANVGDAASLDPTKGYVHRRSDASTTLTFSGQNLYAQDATLSLSNNAGTYGGWHLVSNPYTAYLNWAQVIGSNLTSNMSNTYYIRSYNSNNQDVDALISYNAANGLESNTSSFGLGNTGATTAQYIAPLQAFWVKVPPTAPLSSTAGALRLERAFTSHQTGTLKNTGVYPVLAKVNLYNGAKYDQALVYMNEFMTNAFDQNDSEKMFVSGVASVYTMASGKKLVMNGIKNNKKKISVPLYLELPTSKVYQLQLSDYIMEDGLILLEDKQEGTIQDFTIHDTYAFYANSGLLSNRFVLHFFMPDAGVSAQGPSNSWVEEEESVINEGGSILVSSNGRGKVTITQDIDASAAEKGSVVVRDAAGREIYNGQLTGSATHLELNAPSGIYFVSVELNGQVEVKKIFVQQ